MGAPEHIEISEPAPADTRLVAPVQPPESPAVPVLNIDGAARRVCVADEELPLTTQLFDLLMYLLDRRGEAVSFEDLAEAIWAYPPGGDHHFLHTAVYRLRRVLAAAGVDGLIDGIRGFGYRIDAHPRIVIEHRGDAARAIAVFNPADPDLRMTMVNDGALRLTGYSVEALTNLRDAVTQLWPPDDRAILDRAVQSALESGTAQSDGRQLLRADGTTIVVNVSICRLGVSGQEPLCLAEVTPVK